MLNCQNWLIYFNFSWKWRQIWQNPQKLPYLHISSNQHSSLSKVMTLKPLIFDFDTSFCINKPKCPIWLKSPSNWCWERTNLTHGPWRGLMISTKSDLNSVILIFEQFLKKWFYFSRLKPFNSMICLLAVKKRLLILNATQYWQTFHYDIQNIHRNQEKKKIGNISE